MEPSHESVGIGGSFASQVSSGIPLEIVDAENAQTSERNRQNVSADESMEIDTSVGATAASETGQQISAMDKGTSGGLGGIGGGLTPSDQLSAAKLYSEHIAGDIHEAYITLILYMAVCHMCVLPHIYSGLTWPLSLVYTIMENNKIV